MGFRGVLLAAREADVSAHVGAKATPNTNANASGSTNAKPKATTGEVFRVVCPDASLQLPTSGVPRDAPYVVEQKMVVTDYVTAELQQVTRLAGVQVERSAHSVLWIAVVPAKVHDGETALGSAFAFDPLSLVRHVCYCFHFRSSADFEIFERAYKASRHLQQYSLLENSVRVEVAIQQDPALNVKPKSKSPMARSLPVPAGHEELRRVREQLRKDLLKHTIKEQQQKQVREICEKAAQMEAERVRAANAEAKRAKEKEKKTEAIVATAAKQETEAKASSSVPSPADMEECILCGADSTCRRFAGKFVNHPYLLKDGRGKPVIVCKVCLQHVLKRRVEADRARGEAFPTTDDLCGLCTEPIAQIKGDSKACTHPQCPRVYCSPCLKKLFGKAQVKKVFRVKKWFCPNCETPGESVDEPGEEETPALEVEVEGKKRKRDHDKATREGSLVVLDEEEVLKPPVDIDKVPTTGSTMTPLDYASTYYEFLTGREEQPTAPKESEDVCFCCKDGGDVIECDWKKCPKVYHQDCLGFKVQEGVDWFCPRHRCFKCGFGARYACRLCVTSFCNNDLPEGTKQLGPATAEISDVTYVLCTACDYMSKKALERKKISQELYERLLHPPSPRKKRSTANSKQKKRLR